MSTVKGLKEVVNLVLQGFRKDNIIYLELRSSPKEGKDYNTTQYFETIIEQAAKYEKEMPVRLIVSLNRGIKNFAVYNTLLEDIRKITNWKKYIVGIDFSGDPASRTFEQFIPFLKGARQMGLGMSIHTAEVEEQVPETDTILSLKPERLGHFNYYNQKELENVKKIDSIVEVCISSNMFMKNLNHLEEHHADEFVRQGIRHCICTDDILLVESALSQQFVKYSQVTKRNAEECYQVGKDTIDYTFDKDIRPWLHQQFATYQKEVDWKMVRTLTL